MKIAIVGTGIAGNVVAHRLYHEHDISVFEAGSHIGGHSHTHDVIVGDRAYAVDTGFIVFNDWTYPRFIELIDELGVASRPSHMSFSVRCEQTRLEYNGTSLDTLFAQRRNLLRPRFWRMLREILRFNREAPRLLDTPAAASQTLGEYLAHGNFAREFIDYYIIPMGAAIWSADPQRLLDFPARFFVRFFHNHGMLSVSNRPTWRVIDGGSRRYVDKLTAPFRDRVRLNTPVEWVQRYPTHVMVKARGSEPERYDALFLACHSDQALRLLADATAPERAVLGAIPYQQNEVVLHTDTRLLPQRRRAWAAWNYHVLPEMRGRAAVTYNMNILQGIEAPVTFCVTLNRSEAIAPDRIIRRLTYHHPVYTAASVAAQARQGEINGARRTYYCGAYWRHGFHEDGVVSALAALEHFNEGKSDAQRDLRRAG
ncbi:MAG: FAD-dependent oxidoreductase [Gammaproteobacteria bacterium]|nr:FAD-dependent oxidoreductase [Gammaproteobacteria bacterium]MDH5487812.1 FAD-dependent oxidoreductase [Gammaproteobacteria bacterium]